MTTLNALDYSYGRPDLGVLAAEGIQLVCRYLSHDPSKDLSADEAAQIHAAGLGVLLNWESDRGRPLLGAVAGAQDGADAAALAETIGAPHGLTIFYSCDTDTDPSQYPAIDAYYSAAAAASAGRYLTGVYGEADLIDHLYGHSSVTSYWQTVAWSGGRVSSVADLLQFAINQSVGGASVDYDQIINAALLGAWWSVGHDPSGGGTPITEDDTVKLELIELDDSSANAGIWLRSDGLPLFKHLGDPSEVDYYLHSARYNLGSTTKVDGPTFQRLQTQAGYAHGGN